MLFAWHAHEFPEVETWNCSFAMSVWNATILRMDLRCTVTFMSLPPQLLSDGSSSKSGKTADKEILLCFDATSVFLGSERVQNFPTGKVAIGVRRCFMTILRNPSETFSSTRSPACWKVAYAMRLNNFFWNVSQPFLQRTMTSQLDVSTERRFCLLTAEYLILRSCKQMTNILCSLNVQFFPYWCLVLTASVLGCTIVRNWACASVQSLNRYFNSSFLSVEISALGF